MKKFLTYILIIIISTIGILGPLGIKKTEALNSNSKKSATSKAVVFDANVKKAAAAEAVGFDPARKLRETVWCFKPVFNINMGGCGAIFGYNVYVLSVHFVGLSGSLFDTLLAFSIDTKIINQDFIQNSWQAIRDFVNMLFILILVVISISIILDIGSFASTTLIRNVIIVALLVNFSLFATRVVIDVGNITAKGFYDAINIPVKKDPVIQNKGILNKSISGALLSGFNPARLISPKSFKAWRKNYVSKTKGTQTANFALLYIFVIGATLNCYLAYVLFMVSWLFVTRIIWLWILMILSPLAFVSFAVPGFEKHGKKWWDKLVDNSFGIVVFMFLIWLTLRIITSDFMKSAFSIGDDPSLRKLIVIIVMQGIMVFVLLKTALEKTKEMIDDGGFGDKVLGFAKTGATVAAAVATGGTSLAVRQVLGGWAQRKVERDTKAGKGTTRFGALKLKALRKVGGAKFGTKEGYRQRTERVAGEHFKYQESLPETVRDKDGNFVSKPREEYLKSIAKGDKIPFINIRLQSPLSYILGKRSGEKKFTTQNEELLNVQKESAAARGELDRLLARGADPRVINNQKRIILEKQSKLNKIKEKIKTLKKAAEPKKEDKKKKKKKK